MAEVIEPGLGRDLVKELIHVERHRLDCTFL